MIEKNSSMRQLIDFRLEKLNRLKELGIEPFPHKYNPTHKSIDIISSFNDLEKQTVCVAGRIMALRKMGKASFIHVMDDKGKIQIFIKKDNVGDKVYEAFNLMDIGDFIELVALFLKQRLVKFQYLLKNLMYYQKYKTITYC